MVSLLPLLPPPLLPPPLLPPPLLPPLLLLPPPPALSTVPAITLVAVMLGSHPKPLVCKLSLTCLFLFLLVFFDDDDDGDDDEAWLLVLLLPLDGNLLDTLS